MQGEVEVTARDGDGSPVSLGTLGPGDYFGEMSLMTGTPRVATVTTNSEACLLKVDKQSFKELIEAQPDLIEEMGSALRIRLEERSRAMAGAGRPVPEPQDIFGKIRDFFAT
jgi:CRP-like cAMP-binding protein